MKNPEVEFPEIKTMLKTDVFVKVAYMRLNDKNVPVFIGKIIPKKDLDSFSKELKKKYNSPLVELITIEAE